VIKILQKPDIVAIATFLLLAVALLFIFFTGNTTDGARIIVIADGEEVYNLSLEELEGQSHTIATILGENVISVEGGRVSMTRADCHGGDCVRWPALTNTFQRIICLPNRIVVMLQAEDANFHHPEIDVMTLP